MVFRGTIVNGRVQLSKKIDLPNGTVVEVRPVRPRSKTTKATTKPHKRKATRANKTATQPARPRKSLWDELKHIVGSVPGIPADASLNVDHYLYGAPKR